MKNLHMMAALYNLWVTQLAYIVRGHSFRSQSTAILFNSGLTTRITRIRDSTGTKNEAV